MTTPYICTSCRRSLKSSPQTYNGAVKRLYTRPSFAPKPVLDLKHIRQNPGLYEQNCLDRNYGAHAQNSWRILELHNEVAKKQAEILEVRRRNNALGREIQQQAGTSSDTCRQGSGVSALVEEARRLKEDLQKFEQWESAAREQMEKLAIDLPNLSSNVTPVGEEPELLGYVNESHGRKEGRSHVEIGKELDILDFEASAVTSGWGWYFLKNEGALLEQALIQYALAVAMRKGWRVMTPPSLVYSHIASGCGFMPRDQNGETQRYEIAGDASSPADADKPSLVLAGTAEIPFAGSQAGRTLKASALPLKVIGPSRSYRAEAGARGVDTKGLYRVHEFTKVEMFAWTSPPTTSTSQDGNRFDSDDELDELDQTRRVFDEMLSIQTEILTNLGLHARVLEMPTTDLGASATRKVDIEAFFPSRAAINEGYGEVTSASICTDYQSRRLGTRVKDDRGGKPIWPYTVNGTAIAIPRVLACLLETGWDESSRTVNIPTALRPYILGGIEKIGPVGLRSVK
ncbi:hypothetical protein BDY17DRAFT_303358 [Neohortaea acidophila]|uniref:serine--tRNA ligase n=1 Tax=Neohortaea acidophila TaxID=245834 RepID=A0A6A6PJJ7_9PEZI|nr:uncharacterized protein BDY17DRAFT_303358 [Neohortaea acidophila]KAF2480172.1 hypothetical protein BDY17DRAFT_303358 [Neohortaea acidophila]